MIGRKSEDQLIEAAKEARKDIYERLKLAIAQGQGIKDIKEIMKEMASLEENKRRNFFVNNSVLTYLNKVLEKENFKSESELDEFFSTINLDEVLANLDKENVVSDNKKELFKHFISVSKEIALIIFNLQQLKKAEYNPKEINDKMDPITPPNIEQIKSDVQRLEDLDTNIKKSLDKIADDSSKNIESFKNLIKTIQTSFLKKRDLTSLQTTEKNLNDELQRLRSERESIQDKLRKINQVSGNKNFEQLSQEKIELEKQINELNKRCATYNQDVNAHNTNVSNFFPKIADTVSILGEKSTFAIDKKSAIDQVSKAFSNFKILQQELEKRINSLNEEIKTLSQKKQLALQELQKHQQQLLTDNIPELSDILKSIKLIEQLNINQSELSAKTTELCKKQYTSPLGSKTWDDAAIDVNEYFRDIANELNEYSTQARGTLGKHYLDLTNTEAKQLGDSNSPTRKRKAAQDELARLTSLIKNIDITTVQLSTNLKKAQDEAEKFYTDRKSELEQFKEDSTKAKLQTVDGFNPNFDKEMKELAQVIANKKQVEEKQAAKEKTSNELNEAKDRMLKNLQSHLATTLQGAKALPEDKRLSVAITKLIGEDIAFYKTNIKDNNILNKIERVESLVKEIQNAQDIKKAKAFCGEAYKITDTDSILTPKKQLTAAVPSESKKPGIPVSWVVGGALFGIAVATIVIGVSIFTGGAAIPAVVGAGAAIATFVTGSTASAITAAIVGGVALTAGAAAAGSILGMAAKGIKQTFSWFKEKFFGPKEEVKKQVPTESTAISPNNIGPPQKTTAKVTNALKSQPHESHDHKQDKQEEASKRMSLGKDILEQEIPKPETTLNDTLEQWHTFVVKTELQEINDLIDWISKNAYQDKNEILKLELVAKNTKKLRELYSYLEKNNKMIDDIRGKELEQEIKVYDHFKKKASEQEQLHQDQGFKKQ